jgi:hypothetical protein
MNYTSKTLYSGKPLDLYSRVAYQIKGRPYGLNIYRSFPPSRLPNA